MKIITLYDGTINAKTALQYGLKKAEEKKAELIVLQVFQSSLFVDYDAGPMAEAAARAEANRFQREAEALISAAGLKDAKARIIRKEGDPVEETIALAEAERPGMVLVPAAYKAVARKSAYPVYVMPGTILLPVDNSEMLKADVTSVIAEAKAAASQVLLLGIIPIHLYSNTEKEELNQVTAKTTASVRKIGKTLQAQGVETKEVMCSGYPDDEIVKAAEKYSVSLIMFPAGGKTPSELTKAAAILLDEPERIKFPVLVLNAAGLA